MQFEISAESRKKAKRPHELFMINLVVCNMFLTPVSFFLLMDIRALFIPLFCSGSVIVFIYLRGNWAEKTGPWFEMVNWKLAFRRATFLLIAYAVSAVIIIGGWLMAQGAATTMQDILITISSRIGIMPTFILVIVTFVLESGSIYQVGKGEIPDSVLRKYPAPADIPAIEMVAEGVAGIYPD